jgi:hypothetical protein
MIDALKSHRHHTALRSILECGGHDAAFLAFALSFGLCALRGSVVNSKDFFAETINFYPATFDFQPISPQAMASYGRPRQGFGQFLL